MTEKRRPGRPRNPNPAPGRDGYIYVTVDGPDGKPIRTGQHRVVARENWGDDPHACFWCDAWPLYWDPPAGEQQIHVDHVDHDRSNNDPENVVPSCQRCNARRKKMRARDEPTG